MEQPEAIMKGAIVQRVPEVGRVLLDPLILFIDSQLMKCRGVSPALF
jgi:hypothetical protein